MNDGALRSEIVVAGAGAVSPAGWGVEALRMAIDDGTSIPTETLSHLAPNAQGSGYRLRRVPALESRPKHWRHGRVRRASPISRFALGAAWEAMEASGWRQGEDVGRLGIVFCTTCGGVEYSRRFYQEVLEDPPTASPMLFPETVFNAPSSHLAAIFGTGERNHTLIGDGSVVAQALALAAQWLTEGWVDSCLVVAAEEADALTADAFRHFSKSLPTAEGAGALLLKASALEACGERPSLCWISELSPVSDFGDPSASAARLVPVEVAHNGDATLVVSCNPSGEARDPRLAAESAAWAGWRGERVCLRPCLGEGFAAGAMWQCVVGVDRLRTGRARCVGVSLVGQFAFAAALAFARGAPIDPRESTGTQ